MELDKDEAETLDDAIDYWRQRDLISEQKAQRLRQSYDIQTFDWQRLAKYSFWAAIACSIIAAASIWADGYIQLFMQFIGDLIARFFESSDFVICLFFAAVAGVFYAWGRRRKQQHPERFYSNETIFAAGILSTAASIAYLGIALSTGSNNPTPLLLLATAVYGILGVILPSRFVWISSILSFSGWFGAKTGYMSGTYFIGMNYPLRFVLFGLLLIVSSFSLQKSNRLDAFFKPTYILGHLHFFIALWILSILGNYGKRPMWEQASHLELLHWSVMFGIAAIGAIIYGLRNDDHIAKGFGLTFLFINLYTKFFELFWDTTHKAIVFAVLGVSFWLIGRKAESIWNLNRLPRPLNRNDGA